MIETIEEENELQNDELIRLVTGNANISSQYVIFQNIRDDYYAINVAKVDELIMNKNLNMVKSTQKDSLIQGVAKIRENMITIVNFDRWLGLEEADAKEYKLIMLCHYSNKRLGLIIKKVVGIQSIDIKNMSQASQKDDKTAYIIELKHNQEKNLCDIFDSDRLIFDIFPTMGTSNINSIKNINNRVKMDKTILFAEDSKLIQEYVRKLFEKMDCQYEIFDNGKALLDKLESSNLNDIGLIVSDIEMPIMDGLTLLKNIKNKFGDFELPVIINSNMANDAVIKSSLDLGAVAVVNKLDMQKLQESIVRYYKK
mgnify:FL=1